MTKIEARDKLAAVVEEVYPILCDENTVVVLSPEIKYMDGSPYGSTAWMLNRAFEALNPDGKQGLLTKYEPGDKIGHLKLLEGRVKTGKFICELCGREANVGWTTIADMLNKNPEGACCKRCWIDDYE